MSRTVSTDIVDRAWLPISNSELSAQAHTCAFAVLKQFTDRSYVLSTAEQHSRQTTLPYNPSWVPYSLSFGDAGVALAMGYGHRVHPEQCWDAIGHYYVREVATSLHTGMRPKLIGGLSGLGFAMNYLSLGGRRYQAALKQIEILLRDALKNTLHELPVDKGGVRVSAYDLVSGVAGVGRYLLNARYENRLQSQLNEILDWLIARSKPADMRGFYTPHDKILQSEWEMYPYLRDGYVNCGLAHGLPGPLALLALSKLSGNERQGHSQAVQAIASWLRQEQYQDLYGPNWPTHRSDGEERKTITRTAWCYGLPGVARSLYLAGLALNDVSLKQFAAEALLSVQTRPIETRGIPSPTFCHGIAGLLQIVLRFANDTRDAAFFRFGESLVTTLLDMYDAEAPFGFRDVEPQGHRVDSPGLLTGALGPTLALLAASTDCPPDWDQVFLLS